MEERQKSKLDLKDGHYTHLPTIVIESPPEDEDPYVVAYHPTKPADICCICLTKTNILHLVQVPANAVMHGIKPFLSSCGIIVDKEETVNNEQLLHLNPLGVQQWCESSGFTLKIIKELLTSMNKIGWDLIPQKDIELRQETIHGDQLAEQDFIALYFIKHDEPMLSSFTESKFFGIILPHSATMKDVDSSTLSSLEMRLVGNLDTSGMELCYAMECVVTEDPAEDFRNFGIWIFKYCPNK